MLKYRVRVKTSGKYHNIVLGARYFRFQKEADKFVDQLREAGAECVAEKWTRLYFGVYCWSEGEYYE